MFPVEIATRCGEEKRTSQHGVFLGGHPSKYYPTGLNFSDYVVADDEFRKNIEIVRLISYTDMHTDGKRRSKQNGTSLFIFHLVSSKVKPGRAGLVLGWVTTVS